MYTKFEQTPGDGYVMKKQGLISVFILGGLVGVLGIYVLAISVNATSSGTLAFIGLLTLLFAAFIFLGATRKFIIYPSRKIISYSKNFLLGTKEFSFDEFQGSLVAVTKNIGITIGNSLILEFNRNGKYKKIELARNISAKNQRIILEEIYQLMDIEQ
jgi:hypothetical protein